MVTEAVLITGGKSAEMYHPDRDSPCVLPDLPDLRHSHTQDGSLVCGGYEAEAERSCRRWNPESGAWDLVTDALTEDRWGHISWTPANGSKTYLIGGGFSSDGTTETSEVVDQDNKSVNASFPLQHRTK